MFDWIPGDTINCIYFALVGIGLIWTLIALLGADFGDVDVGGPDIDFHVGEIDLGGIHVPEVDLGVEAPDVDVGPGLQFPSISPFAIAGFITGFGAGGIIANLAFNIPAMLSLLFASFGGLVLGGVVQVFFGAFLLKSQGSSEVKVSQLTGAIAEVIVPIEPGTNGQIAFVAQGRRVTYGARALGDAAIARGEQVQIVRIVGGTALVRRVEESGVE